MTVNTWARLGLSLVFGLAAFVVSIIAMWAFVLSPVLTIAFLLGITSALGMYVYDTRTEPTDG